MNTYKKERRRQSFRFIFILYLYLYHTVCQQLSMEECMSATT